jgi:hypothetical protein
MRYLILGFGFALMSSTAQAQYDDLINLKLSQLSQLEDTIEATKNLPEADSDWALVLVNDSRELLIQASDENIDALRLVEAEINHTVEKVAARLLSFKKAKLMSRITTLDTMITQYQSEGLDTSDLEALSEAMKMHMQRLNS